jgi:phosphatidylglycerophosphate synthase
MTTLPRPPRRKFRQETVIHSFFLRPLAWELVRLIWYTPITPNQVTVFRIILNILALVLFATGDGHSYWLGVLIFMVHEICDYIDGMLARAKKISSDLGATMEIVGDVLFSNGSTILGFAIALGAYRASGNPLIFLAFAFIPCMAECSSIFHRYRVKPSVNNLHINHDNELFLTLFTTNPKLFIVNFAHTVRKFRNYILIFGFGLSYLFTESQEINLTVVFTTLGLYIAFELARLIKGIGHLIFKY